jgi:Anti-sigma factor NepR
MSDFQNEKRRQEAIGRRLRKMYDDVVNEGDAPDEFLNILRNSPIIGSPDKNSSDAGPKPDKKD